MSRPDQVRDSVDRHVEQWTAELDWLDPLHEAIIARLMLVSRHLARERDTSYGGDGPPRTGFKVLLALRRHGPPYTASPSDLADDLGLSRGALSARLGPLERQGLITRSVDRDDRRRVQVRLTAAGKRAFDRHARHEGRVEAALLDTLSVSEQRRLADLLRNLVIAAEDP